MGFEVKCEIFRIYINICIYRIKLVLLGGVVFSLEKEMDTYV